MTMKLNKFVNKELDLSINSFTDKNNTIYFSGKSVASALGYSNERKAIRIHVFEEDKIIIKTKITPNSRGPKMGPQVYNTIYINESGLYSLIMRSKMKSAILFQKWVTSVVLPSIRKTGSYSINDKPIIRQKLTIEIKNEFDLHAEIVSYIRRFYPQCIIIAQIGENQDTASKRIKSWQLGYQKGQPYLIIGNLHKYMYYSGMAIELKTPLGNGVVSIHQKELVNRYKDNGYKTLISNDFHLIIREINEYFLNVRILCKFCKRKFISRNTLFNHKKYFHRID